MGKMRNISFTCSKYDFKGAQKGKISLFRLFENVSMEIFMNDDTMLRISSVASSSGQEETNTYF